MPESIEELENRVRSRPVPRHVAIIMDGNGRWANARGLPRLAGHREGAKSVRSAVETSLKVGIEALTLYAFSSQNWSRPKEEIEGLMDLLASFLESEEQSLSRKSVALHALGDLDRLPREVRTRLDKVVDATRTGRLLKLGIALSYGGREEIVMAARDAAEDGPIDEASIAAHLWTNSFPELDLLIRTGGDMRLSNFMLWQCAYSELYFADERWPEFREGHFLEALEAFQSRERRYGTVSSGGPGGAAT